MITLIISDIHIGSAGCKAKNLNDFLKKAEFDRLILVGDIIDGWQLKRKFLINPEEIKLISKLLKISSKKEVIWITGNHDEFLRNFSPIEIGNIKIVDEYMDSENGGIWYVHGDKYDGIVQMSFLAYIGSIGYELSLFVDKIYKSFNGKRSLSKWIKDNAKNVVGFLTKFEDSLVHECKKRYCKTVVCGHVHYPRINTVKNVLYVNPGDWIENCSYILHNSETNNFVLYYYNE